MCGAIALAGCGGTSSSSSSVQGAGQGVGARLIQEGLGKCVGPLASHGDPSPANGNPDPVSLAVYGEHGFAAVVASGAGAQDHAVNLAVIRNHVAGNVTAAQLAQIESSWLDTARKALRGSGVAPGPCTSEVPKMPVLSATEVVCPDEVLIPLGRKPAINRFVNLLSSMLQVNVTPEQRIYLLRGGWLTIPEKVQVTRPYCHR